MYVAAADPCCDDDKIKLESAPKGYKLVVPAPAPAPAPS